jgi:large subunit ribosomal protein L1
MSRLKPSHLLVPDHLAGRQYREGAVMAKSKQYNDNAKKYDRDRLHSDEEAIAILKSLGTKNFDETVDLVVCLGVDPRKADQMIRATVALPSGTGKDVRIAVFAQGEAATAARDAGADFVGGDELAAEVEKGMTDFDLAIATPDMMPTVGKLGRVLGPRGLMPNPKTGTVTPDVAKAIEEFKGGKVEYRTDRFANVHVPIGKASFAEAALLANLRAVITELDRVRPASAKGHYMKKVVISTTMGPGVRIDPAKIVAEVHD